MSIEIRGTRSEEEVKRKRLLRDTRGLGSQLWDALGERDTALLCLLVLAVMPFVQPLLTVPCAFLGWGVYRRRMRVYPTEALPFRLPKTAGCEDPNDPKPGRESGNAMASGIFFLGREHGTRKQLWLKAKDMLTHMLVFGTTGSGKTEFLVSMAFNALAMGSGFSYVDPKGAPKLPFQIYTMCRMLGRDDDFRIMNYNTGGKSVAQHGPKRMSNSQNPFAFAPADAIVQLIVSLIPKSEGGNAIFAQNAQVVISGIIYGLVDLRDKGYIKLSTQIINEHLNLTQADSLARDFRLSAASAHQVKTALRTVGWREEASIEDQIKNSKSLSEQFGYARAYFGQFLIQLGYTYGYIFGHQIGEIDMHDVIIQKRILCVILPSLEKSPPELESLGKITLSSIRNATAVGLGNKIQGTAEDVLFSLPTDAPIPFLTITDEYAAIPTPGFAEVLTQGRGLGIAAIVASQDWAGIEESDKKGAQQIAANTKIKICLKLEDAKGTWELFKALAGEMLTMKTQGYEYETENMSGAYLDNKSAKAELESRIHLRDLQEQTEGEFHSFFNGNIVRGAAFYADPPINKTSQLRIPQLLPVMPPNIEQIHAQKEKTRNVGELLIKIIENQEKLAKPYVSEQTDVYFMKLRKSFSVCQDINLQNNDKAIYSFINFIKLNDNNIILKEYEENKRIEEHGNAVMHNFMPDDDIGIFEDPSGDNNGELDSFENIQNDLTSMMNNEEDRHDYDIISIEKKLGASGEEVNALEEQLKNIKKSHIVYPTSRQPKKITVQQLEDALKKLF